MFVVPRCEWLCSSDSRWSVLVFPFLELGAVQNEMCFCIISLFVPFLFLLSFFLIRSWCICEEVQHTGHASPRKANHCALKAQKYFWKISIWRETVIWRETSGESQQKCPCYNKENASQCSDWMNLQGKQIAVLETLLNRGWQLSHSSSAFKDQYPGWTVAQAAVPQLCAQACRGAGTALTQPVPQLEVGSCRCCNVL